MGAGKSYWGKQLAEHWSLPYYDLDEIIVAEEEMAISDIFATRGEDYSANVKAPPCAGWYSGKRPSWYPAAGARPASRITWTS